MAQLNSREDLSWPQLLPSPHHLTVCEGLTTVRQGEDRKVDAAVTENGLGHPPCVESH